jgi:hypothetical protein
MTAHQIPDGGTESQVVNIRPGVGILSVLRHLNYQPWFALAEFVDNSLQSYLVCREQLRDLHGHSHRLRVEILLDPLDDGRIVIRDNAGGIRTQDFARAFRPAEIPPDRSGLNEFGMGMKSAACWFAPRWHVRTSALGEPLERTIRFEVAKIIEDSLEELGVETRVVPTDAHYTEIVLLAPFRMPYGRTVGKIKDHLTDIYRVFTRSGDLMLHLNDERLLYEEPDMLQAPRFNQADGDPIEWRKDINLDLGAGQRIRGFAALRETASTKRAGFALFRRGRLIQGSGEEGYRPYEIFGNPNSYRFQRIFGELHLEGFDVSHTKDGFQWDHSEQRFLEALRVQLDAEPLPLLKQAEGWRASTKEVRTGAEEAAVRTANVMERTLPSLLYRLEEKKPSANPPETLPEAELAARRAIRFRFRREEWEIVIEMSNSPAVGDWLEISEGLVRDDGSGDAGCRRLGIRLSLSHPFMTRFAGNSAERIEPLLRVAAALALAEHAAYSAGVKYASTIRANVNELLRDALSSAP